MEEPQKPGRVSVDVLVKAPVRVRRCCDVVVSRHIDSNGEGLENYDDDNNTDENLSEELAFVAPAEHGQVDENGLKDKVKKPQGCELCHKAQDGTCERYAQGDAYEVQRQTTRCDHLHQGRPS